MQQSLRATMTDRSLNAPEVVQTDRRVKADTRSSGCYKGPLCLILLRLGAFREVAEAAVFLLF